MHIYTIFEALSQFIGTLCYCYRFMSLFLIESVLHALRATTLGVYIRTEREREHTRQVPKPKRMRLLFGRVHGDTFRMTKRNTTTNQQQNTQHNNRRHINEKLSESHLFEQENRFHLHVLLNIFEDDDVDNDDGRPSKYKSKAATNKKNRKIIEPAQFEQLMSYKFAF